MHSFPFLSFQKLLYVTLTFTLLLGAAQLRKLFRQGQKMFLPRSCYAPNVILIRKTFQYIWAKKFPV